MLTSLRLAVADEADDGAADDGAADEAEDDAAEGRTGPLAAEYCVASRLIRSKASSNPFAPALGGRGGLTLEGEKLEFIGFIDAMLDTLRGGLIPKISVASRGIGKKPCSKIHIVGKFHLRFLLPYAQNAGAVETKTRNAGIAFPNRQVSNERFFSKNDFCPLRACQGATTFSPPRSRKLQLIADTDIGWLSFPIRLISQQIGE